MYQEGKTGIIIVEQIFERILLNKFFLFKYRFHITSDSAYELLVFFKKVVDILGRKEPCRMRKHLKFRHRRQGGFSGPLETFFSIVEQDDAPKDRKGN